MTDVTSLADSLQSKVREYTQNESLKLVGILANQGLHRYDSGLYSKRIQETFLEDGIDYELWRCPPGGADPSPCYVRCIQDQICSANDLTMYMAYSFSIPSTPMVQRARISEKLTGVYFMTHDHHCRELVDPAKDGSTFLTVHPINSHHWCIRVQHPVYCKSLKNITY